MALYVYVSNGMFVLDADEHLLADMIPFAKHCRANATSHQRSVTQMRIASSCRYDPIWKALQGRCHFAPVTQMSIASSCRYDPIWKALPGRCHFAPASCCR